MEELLLKKKEELSPLEMLEWAKPLNVIEEQVGEFNKIQPPT